MIKEIAMEENAAKWKNRKLTYLSPADIRPEGWLKRQLELQARGLSGHLDLIWPDVRDSKWIGGDREGWERVPYWLDGFIPLAWLLEDAGLQARAKRYIDAILSGQQEDGWVCPCSVEERERYDVWAAFLICKVLVVYEACSKDERIEEAVYRALKQLLCHISAKTLFGWGAARWFECMIPLLWLHERRPEPWMDELAYVLEGCGIDYEKLYTKLSFKKPDVKRYWTYVNHVVNVAMALKSRAEMSLLTGEDCDAFALEFYRKLMKEHGMAIGHFTGDECLAGTSPLQGSECCSVVEAMYSYEELLSVGGNPFWGDLLEQAAFNGLATTVSADMWTHQYDQMTNQVECTRVPEEKVVFCSNSGESHNFGLEPNFGCCTANFNQGWPKFALSAVMGTKEGLAVTAIAPVRVETSVLGKNVCLWVDTRYPFRDTLRIKVLPQERFEFEISVRIPGFAKSARVRMGEEVQQACPGTFFTKRKMWGEEEIEISFTFEPEFVERPSGMAALRRGPLFYALPIEAEYERIEYERDGVERKFPYCDYAIRPKSDWAFGFGKEDINVVHEEFPAMPFDREKPPVMLEMEMVPLDWRKEDGMCKEKPESARPAGAAVTKRLYPYGCTTLRMAEMPRLAKAD
nr:beta-L-arabinofuranosidase domain-containing protein [uncultured Acetatifactor sp.]